MSILGDDWIQTDGTVRGRTTWVVVLKSEVVQRGEVRGDDPSGILAYAAALDWAELHHPNVSFHWQHRLPAGAVVTRPRKAGGTSPG